MNPQSLVLTSGGAFSRPILTFLFSCAVASSVYAANEGQTNEADLYYASPYLGISITTESDAVMDRLFREITSSDDVVFDQLSTAGAQLDRIRQLDRFGYGSFQNLNSEGARLFGRIGLDSLRAAAVAALPLEMWQDHWEGWFGNFLAGTIGNPEEEHLKYTSTSYSAVRTTWERGNDDAGIQWGIRPWRTSPYIYVLAKAGHYEGRSLITAEGRAGYTMFGSSKIEGRVALALPASFQLAAAAVWDPARTSYGGGGTHFAATLERLIGSSNLQQTTLFFVGFRSGYRADYQRSENVLIAGLTRRW